MSSKYSDIETAACLIIAGMHRSGTSLVASLLQSAGLHIGQTLMRETTHNRKGHFENIEFYQFHQSVLRSQGISEDGWTLQILNPVEEPYHSEAKWLIENNRASPIWGWKDPRTVLFLDFWAHLLPDAKFLLVYRTPWDVVDSLYRRGDKLFQKQPELAVKIWLHYNQRILDFYQRHSHRCLLVGLPIIAQYADTVIEEINHKFGFSLTPSASGIYEPDLLNRLTSKNHCSSLIYYYFPEAIDLLTTLETISWYPSQSSADLAWRDRTVLPFHQLASFGHWMQLRTLEQQQENLKIQLNQQQAENQQLQAVIHSANSANDAQEQSLQLAQVNLQLQQTQVELTQARSQLAQLQTEQALVQTQLTEAQTKLQQSQQQLHNTQNVLEQFQSQLHQTESLLEQSQHQLQQKQTDCQQTQVILQQTQAELVQVQTDYQSLDNEILQMRSTYQTTQNELSETQKQSDHWQAQQQQAKSELEQTCEQLRQTEDVLQQSQAQLQQTEGILQQFHTQLLETRSELEQTQEQLQQSQTQLAEAQAQQQQTEKKLTSVCDQAAQTEAHLNQKNEQLSTTNMSLRALLQTMFEEGYPSQTSDYAAIAKN